MAIGRAEIFAKAGHPAKLLLLNRHQQVKHTQCCMV